MELNHLSSISGIAWPYRQPEFVKVTAQHRLDLRQNNRGTGDLFQSELYKRYVFRHCREITMIVQQ